MKPIVKTLIIMLFLSFELTNPATAQLSANEYAELGEFLPSAKNTPVYQGDKNHEVAILETAFPKTARNFLKRYPEAKSPLWIKEGRLLFVYFSNKGNKVSAVFTPSGFMHYSITTLPVSALPDNISRRIGDEFPASSVFCLKQINASGSITYQVILESRNEFITVYAGDDELSVDTRFYKS